MAQKRGRRQLNAATIIHLRQMAERACGLDGEAGRLQNQIEAGGRRHHDERHGRWMREAAKREKHADGEHDGGRDAPKNIGLTERLGEVETDLVPREHRRGAIDEKPA